MRILVLASILTVGVAHHAFAQEPYGTLEAPAGMIVGEGMVVHGGELFFTLLDTDGTARYRLQRVRLDAPESTPVSIQTAVLTPLFGLALFPSASEPPLVLISGTGEAQAFSPTPGGFTTRWRDDRVVQEPTRASDGFLTFIGENLVWFDIAGGASEPGVRAAGARARGLVSIGGAALLGRDGQFARVTRAGDLTMVATALPGSLAAIAGIGSLAFGVSESGAIATIQPAASFPTSTVRRNLMTRAEGDPRQMSVAPMGTQPLIAWVDREDLMLPKVVIAGANAMVVGSYGLPADRPGEEDSWARSIVLGEGRLMVATPDKSRIDFYDLRCDGRFGLSCPGTQACDAGRCTEVAECEPACVGNETCNAGECQCGTTEACGDGLTCSLDGDCVPEMACTPACVLPQTCDLTSAMCRNQCDGVLCPAPNMDCEPTTGMCECSCGPGMACLGDECLGECPAPPDDCAMGNVCIDGACTLGCDSANPTPQCSRESLVCIDNACRPGVDDPDAGPGGRDVGPGGDAGPGGLAPKEELSCTCRTAGRSTGGSPWALLALGAVFFWRRRRS